MTWFSVPVSDWGAFFGWHGVLIASVIQVLSRREMDESRTYGLHAKVPTAFLCMILYKATARIQQRKQQQQLQHILNSSALAAFSVVGDLEAPGLQKPHVGKWPFDSYNMFCKCPGVGRGNMLGKLMQAADIDWASRRKLPGHSFRLWIWTTTTFSLQRWEWDCFSRLYPWCQWPMSSPAYSSKARSP